MNAGKPLIALLTFVMLLVGCCPRGDEIAEIEWQKIIDSQAVRLHHLVFFKLNNSAQADVLIADCDAMLAIIPEVKTYFCGTPFNSGRSVVDSNYDVALYAGFVDSAAYRVYLDNPDHQELVKNWKLRLEWMRINDVFDESRQ